MDKLKILFFAADPLSAHPGRRVPRLQLDDEVREIRRKVRNAKYRDQVEFDLRLAARPNDLLEALIETRPQVVHFSGHSNENGLVLVGSDGHPHTLDLAAFSQLLKGFKDTINLVVLNSCPVALLNSIAEIVGCAVGMSGLVSDVAAITFGAAFYGAVAEGRSVQGAVDHALAVLALTHPTDTGGLTLAALSDVEPSLLFLIPRKRGYSARPAESKDVNSSEQARQTVTVQPSRSTVFISYSHKDRKWLERLQVHLKPLEREGVITRWDDTLIKPGTQWRVEIERALDTARVAILLISADFLASDYIRNDELPPLLHAAEADGAMILPLVLSPCRFIREQSLAKFQAVNDPARPLNTQTRAKQEEVLDRLSAMIERALQP